MVIEPGQLVIDLGEIEVTIMGKHLPIRRMPYPEQESIAKDLAKIIKRNLNETYGNKYGIDFQMEITGISSGCIKAKYSLTAVVKEKAGWVVAIALFIAAYDGFCSGAIRLWDQANDIIEFVSNGRECRALLSKNHLGVKIYGPVKDGDFLSAITAEIKASCSEFNELSQEDIMAAIYANNRIAFGESIDIIREGSIIVVPGVDLIKSTLQRSERRKDG